MSETNDDLRKQIEQLETAISQRKRQEQQYQQRRPRYNPIWSTSRRGRPPVRPSHNLKLTVKPTPSSSGGEGDSADSATTGYVSYGNKLVRVGSGAAAIRPAYKPRPQARAPNRATRQHTQPVLIDGEEFIRKGRGNKLVRASTTAPSAGPSAATRNRIVSIDGENYVRTKKGSLVRVGALRMLNQKRKRPPTRRRLCTKHLFGKCDNAADKCRYSHVLSPEVVPICRHYQSGICLNTECPFSHVKVNANAPICRPFVYKGYCAKGAHCLHRHVIECPDWVEKGKCARTRCRLPHPAKKEPRSGSVPTKEEEESFMRQYVQRPVFDKQGSADSDPGLADDIFSSDSEGSDKDDDNLSDALTDDEADELLKWYDDNYEEAS
ncbi:hypothetical protein H4R20_000060 [Coemansia guatemalensis]|uniref:C3H1-type domain-containing protein n=1 Tax=Coemansia guatemalensis TaxID=2761395 RepID=A0A9W8I1L8_9FUNG|nr:hypothetical protein H4R20_000060 [Coemansia guatemalensis]